MWRVDLAAIMQDDMNRIGCLVAFAALLSYGTGCIGPDSYIDQPNAIQRAEVLSKNDKSITIEHSTWGKKIAFRLADEHCRSLGKTAVYQGSSQQYGPDVISTWKCEE
jgi:hypothetical protein